METLDKHVYEQLGEDIIMELTGEELRKAAYRYFMDEEKAEKLLSQGEKVAIEKTASRMIERGFADEDIMSITTLPLERINTLRNGS